MRDAAAAAAAAGEYVSAVPMLFVQHFFWILWRSRKSVFYASIHIRNDSHVRCGHIGDHYALPKSKKMRIDFLRRVRVDVDGCVFHAACSLRLYRFRVINAFR